MCNSEYNYLHNLVSSKQPKVFIIQGGCKGNHDFHGEEMVLIRYLKLGFSNQRFVHVKTNQ